MVTESLFFVIAIIWSIVIVYFIGMNYWTYKKQDWFKDNPAQVWAFISFIFLHITLGLTIWSNPFNLMELPHWIFVFVLSLFYFGLYLGFQRLARKRFLVLLNIQYPINKKMKEVLKSP